MTDSIKLVNRDGTIVGEDPETGETVPIEFGETVLESVSADDARLGADPENELSEWGGLIIDDRTNDIKYFAGGRWVTDGEDPADHYPEIVRDGHHWIEIGDA